MKTFHTVNGLREALRQERRAGKRIGFVPTMGNLHAGHIALIEQARESCDVVVCSIFVNALQFGLNEDWDKYPRTFQADSAKLVAAGCDYLFNPEDREMYPNGLDTQSRVICPTMTDVLCGASRPGHFEGVTTVVTKLFNIVQPDQAIFGIKDYQQLAVIRRMSEDLCMAVDIVGAPIHREPDGLAMSSRNSYITAEERANVTVLHDSLMAISTALKAGEKDFADLEQRAMEAIVKAGFKPDYLSISNSKTLEPAADDDRELTVLGAMFTRAARLIDNTSVVLAQGEQ